jgi:hypothetical protein
MTLETRFANARATGYAARQRFERLRREKLQLRESYIEQIHEWRVARMKLEILLAKTRRNRLLVRHRWAAENLFGSRIQ